MTRIGNFVVLLRRQLWIIPALISLAALLLAYAVLAHGSVLSQPRGTHLWWIYSGDAGTARGLLSSLLSGLMTMTSLVVSMTFVILTLAANQLGPRLIGTFMADRQIQAVLGLFLGTILYTLIVLRSLDERLGPDGVPHLAITVASGLTVACLFALLFYVHKIARSIIADTVVERVGRDLRQTVRATLSEKGDGSDRDPPPLAPSAGSVSLDRSGYIQTIDYEALIEAARRAGAVLRVEVRAGHFVLKQGRHVGVHAAMPPDEAAAAIRSAFVIGSERSPAQDLEYAIRQLVEIALRALSPGINDPFTAIAVLDRLGAALEDVVSRPPQPAVLRDGDGAVRVVADRSTTGGLLDAAFDLIRQAGSGHPAVLIRMADVFGQLAPALRADARAAVLGHLDRLEETARHARLAPSDCDAVLARTAQVRAVVQAAGGCGWMGENAVP